MKAVKIGDVDLKVPDMSLHIKNISLMLASDTIVFKKNATYTIPWTDITKIEKNDDCLALTANGLYLDIYSKNLVLLSSLKNYLSPYIIEGGINAKSY